MIEEATLVIRSECAIKVFRPVDGAFVRLRWYNGWYHRWRHADKVLDKMYYPKGYTTEDRGVVSRKVITDTGVAFIVDAFQNLVELEAMNFHAFGTGTAAEAVGNTALGTEVATRSAGTQSEPAANQYRTVGTVSFGSTLTIGEHGIFSVITTSSGVLLDRSLVTPTIGVNNGDSIQATYTLTINSGG